MLRFGFPFPVFVELLKKYWASGFYLRLIKAFLSVLQLTNSFFSCWFHINIK
jgi:hypothetical protein